MNGKTNFYRRWKEYKAGFGSVSEEFWLGNENLHSLTTHNPQSLRVDLRAGNETAHAVYKTFRVDSEKKHYTLHIAGYSGNAGDSLRYHDDRPFSTKDHDPKPFITRCAISYKGGWWYKNCHQVNLNGLYASNKDHQVNTEKERHRDRLRERLRETLRERLRETERERETERV
ncbi:hypothetical protein AOXY_G38845 [Acipenser oxyrinchus oxyrinchus]|uniref:Fibrinogen C-terminal domain-containing protein n=1 Tax=Acipenser oxyrinchus oxyrinchus TaxID=40147 RepID=A0AAD8CE80_ACIOX|nr:hypothetical protein AOXY_G38845 [Acipenser oxyrinchus oxyrinchus]